MDRIKKIYENYIVELSIIVIIVIFGSIFSTPISLVIREFYSEGDTLYWFFSSSAQSIAAFVAFLLTGYSLMLSIMDRLEENDESLGEIHHTLKTSYFGRIKILSILTGIAIVLNLLMIFSKATLFPFKYELVVFTILINIATITSGILLVILIIDPNRYKKIAQKIISSKSDGFAITGEQVSDVDFFKKFIVLEAKLRKTVEILINRNIIKKPTLREFLGFKMMLDLLLYSEQIDPAMYNQLMEVSRYRNLVFHGHIDNVDFGMIKLLDKCLDEMTLVQQHISKEDGSNDLRRQ